jgi:multimeric flavodoxin WrbA
MVKLMAIQGSPRKGGNTEILLAEAVRGAEEGGAQVERVDLRDLQISPCMEIYSCKQNGICGIKDDMVELYRSMDASHRLILASPIFFYSVSATAKIFIDRCQAAWARRYILGRRITSPIERRGAFIAVGATKGKRLFDGVKLTVKYFFDAIDMAYADELLVRGMDEKGEVRNFPEHLQAAYELGKRMGIP